MASETGQLLEDSESGGELTTRVESPNRIWLHAGGAGLAGGVFGWLRAG